MHCVALRSGVVFLSAVLVVSSVSGDTSGTVAPRQQNTWVVQYNESSAARTCLVVKAGVGITFNYSTSAGSGGEGYNIITVNIPAARSEANSTAAPVSSDGSCGRAGEAMAEELEVMFTPEGEHAAPATDMWSLRVAFGCCNTTRYGADAGNQYMLTGVELEYVVSEELFPNVSAGYIGAHTAALRDARLFSGFIGFAYTCFTDSTIDLELQAETDDTVRITISELEYEPFKDRAGTSDSDGLDLPAYVCGADDSMDLAFYIKIGVGIAALTVVEMLVFVALNWHYRRRHGGKSALYDDLHDSSEGVHTGTGKNNPTYKSF